MYMKSAEHPIYIFLRKLSKINRFIAFYCRCISHTLTIYIALNADKWKR